MNSGETLSETMDSLKNQTFKNFEQVIVDSCSIDNTHQIINDYRGFYKIVFKEDERLGVYSALNTGMKVALGEFIGVLHSDDVYNDHNVLDMLDEFILKNTPDVLWGDISYVSRTKKSKVIRTWKSGESTKTKIKNGWMPPHVSVFIRREIIKKYSLEYLSKYKISSDYDFLLNLLLKNDIKKSYISKEIIKMKYGGISNKNIKNIKLKMYEDFQILRSHNISPIRGLLLKNARKIHQFF